MAEPAPLLHLRDAIWVDARTSEFLHGNFVVESGPGCGLRRVESVPATAPVLDCRGAFVTRSFVVAHQHIYSALARGMPPATPAPQTFRQILERVWWRLDRQLDAEMIRASAASSALDALKAGATFVIDHHSSPQAVPGCLDLLAERLDAAGVGHLLCLELSDRDGAAARRQGLAETDRYLTKRRGLVGLHASFTVSDDLLREAVALARKHQTGVHVHVAEALSDQEETIAKHGQRVVHRLAAAGALELNGSLLAHALHLDASERTTVAASRAWVVQNPESNRHNAVGTFQPAGLGERILLGTDGMHADMLASLRAAYLDGQTMGGLAPSAAWQRLQRADDYLAVCGVQRGDNDLVVLAYDPPTPVTPENFAAHVVYALGQSHVRHVVAQGRVVVRDGRVLTLDEAAVRAEARRQAQRLWQRL